MRFALKDRRKQSGQEGMCSTPFIPSEGHPLFGRQNKKEYEKENLLYAERSPRGPAAFAITSVAEWKLDGAVRSAAAPESRDTVFNISPSALVQSHVSPLLPHPRPPVTLQRNVVSHVVNVHRGAGGRRTAEGPDGCGGAGIENKNLSWGRAGMSGSFPQTYYENVGVSRSATLSPAPSRDYFFDVPGVHA
ncbi:hypothetical protein EVAR_96069_1 [Eumeta japonica]|uniref:Uncharacterized protein n=1 Tax=Eumeta variegata TaxID=151549 RepID=A0A4C1W7X7_EUMVA|nr:hypothetical protein EVAR_96069_1 [Eumeta japonica]